MTALTIDIDDRLIDALRETAARRHMTVDAIVGECVSGVVRPRDMNDSERDRAREELRDLMSKSTARMGPDFVWSREATYADRMFPRHERPALRSDRQDR